MSEVVSFDVDQVSEKMNEIKDLVDDITGKINKLHNLVTSESEKLQDSFSPFLKIRDGLNDDLKGLQTANNLFDQIRTILERYADETAALNDTSEF